MRNALNISQSDIEYILDNIDAIYTYIDLFVDQMSEEEIESWKTILEEIDPDYYTNTEDE